MVNLGNITDWEESLGLLPIKLFSKTNEQENYIMLNGGDGDFCLQLQENENGEDYFYSKSWSSNTKNFISTKGENINLYNWKKNKVEEIKKNFVQANYEKFYKYLLQNSFKTESDVVPFILNIYRKLRHLTHEEDEGVNALNLLFRMFACHEDNVDIQNIDFDKWGINQTDLAQDNFAKYYEDFVSGVGALKPDVELIIRHSSGILFQETQKEALFFNNNEDLFGMLSGKYTTKRKTFTSSHYTPAFVARSIVEIAISKIDLHSKKTLKILDPACGTSNFLMEVLKQLKSKNYDGSVNVIGWDTSPSAIQTSNFLLHYELRDWQEKLTFKLEVVDDSLSKDWESDYDLILMNPPYVSWELMNKNMQDSTRITLDNVFEKKPNQASAFLYKCINSLGEDGVLGCVIPATLLTLDSYTKMRKDINDKISFTFIGKLGNYIFDNALTDVTILIGQKPRIAESPTILWKKNEKGIATDALREYRKFKTTNIPFLNNSDFSIYKPQKFPSKEESWKPLSYIENEQIRKIESLVSSGGLTRIKDVFNVKQGIRTGYNNIFKISKELYLEFIPELEKKYFRPVIDNDSIKKNRITTINYVWYPYDKAGMVIKSENELSQKAHFFYSEFLFPNKAILEKRAGITEWWGLTRPRNWQFEYNTRLVSTEFGNSKSFAFDKEGNYVIERGNAWMPKKEIKDINDYYFYLALFSSPFYDKLLSIYSKQLAGGKWYDLGKKHSNEIPIPILNQSFKNSNIYEKLCSIGKRIQSDDFVDFQIIDVYLKKDIYLFNDYL